MGYNSALPYDERLSRLEEQVARLDKNEQIIKSNLYLISLKQEFIIAQLSKKPEDLAENVKICEQ